MILSTVEIKPRATTGSWVYHISRDPTDYSDAKTAPSRLGFYHYPSNISDEEAFNELKTFLLKEHDAKIARLLKSRDELNALTFKP